MAHSTSRGGEQEPLAIETLQMVELVAGGIAHDFNNLLQTIQARVELTLRMGSLTEKQTQHLEGVIECAREAQALTAQLKTLARGGTPQRMRADLSQLAEHALSRCLADADTTHELSASEEAPWAMVDPAQLGQLFDNLLHNARQAMDGAGHVHMTIDRTTGADEGLPPGTYVRICISDNGPGIPEEDRDRIFEPDFTTKPDGTGIGLATCRGVARRHGGQLTCRSELGAGTTFVLVLPQQGADSTPPDAG